MTERKKYTRTRKDGVKEVRYEGDDFWVSEPQDA